MEVEVALAAPNPPAPPSDEDQHDGSSTTAEQGEADSKKTFARRYRPQRAGPAKRWDGIHTIFMRHVKNRFKKPSSFEVLFWNHCVSKQNEVDYEIMNYPYFFEGCVPAFFELDAVKGKMLPGADD